MMVNAIREWLPFQLKIIRQNAFGILIMIDEQKESSTGSFSLKECNMTADFSESIRFHKI